MARSLAGGQCSRASILADVEAIAVPLRREPVVRPDLREQRMTAEIGDEVELLATPGDAWLFVNDDRGRHGFGEVLGHGAIDEKLRAAHFPHFAIAPAV